MSGTDKGSGTPSATTQTDWGTASGRGGSVAALLARTSDWAGWERFSELAAQVGYCTKPVRVRGEIADVDPTTGEMITTYHTSEEPDGVLLLPCRNRRASVCPACSRTYAADTWQLVAAGLRGGKGLPSSVATHPRVFATLTAPSFGPVHTIRGRGVPCQRPVRTLCPHGVDLSCVAMHRPGEAVVGTPVCPQCFDYRGLVVFNALAPKLWARTVMEIRRRLAALSGISVRQVNTAVCLSYTKVAEYQRRGAIHLHAVFRLDARSTEAEPQPPPAPFHEPSLLVAAIHAAAPRVSIDIPAADRRDAVLAVVRWGRQLDVAVITSSQPEQTTNGDRAAPQDRTPARAVANYLAKYVTKALPAHGIAVDDGVTNPHRDHVRQIRRTCRHLGRDPDLGELRTRERVEGFGYPSRPSSRSRNYSTTMGALRAERQQHATTRGDAAEREVMQDTDTLQIGSWRYVGHGWRGLGEAGWVETKAAQRIEAAEHGRQARAAERRNPKG